MTKTSFQSNPRVHQIFDDLTKYKTFCIDFGYKFDEASLYDMRVYAYRQHSKHLAGKQPKDMWAEDTPK